MKSCRHLLTFTLSLFLNAMRSHAVIFEPIQQCVIINRGALHIGCFPLLIGVMWATSIQELKIASAFLLISRCRIIYLDSSFLLPRSPVIIV